MTRMDHAEIQRLILRMAQDLHAQLGAALPEAVMVGIQTGGFWLAERLHRELGLAAPLGSLSTRLYRDDFNRIGLHPKISPSNLSAPIAGRCVILVDDVLHTGRTIRAAMNELFDYGRPAAIRLAVLVDRGGHELPIAADVVGASIELPAGRHAKLSGPEPLRLDILDTPE
jgi:pyrimidine operon attenuation protein / uracil phosphoribosyltransferase